MTYTFKLSRRLAILRAVSAVTALTYLAGCTDESTAPNEQQSATYGFRIVPATATVEVNQPVQFRGVGMRTYLVEGLGGRRDLYPAVDVDWVAHGGSIDASGLFTASSTGTYKVIGRGRGRGKGSDTSVVVVVPPQPSLESLTVSPSSAQVTSGASQAFTVTGYLSDATTAPVGVKWSASGGEIDAGGTYTAGSTAGTYRVIAANTSGTIADTATVMIPSPPPPPPETSLVEVVLKPGKISLDPGGKARFGAYGQTSDGDSVSVVVTFSATGGTITSDGLYTAGSTPGSYGVVASASGLADTTPVTVNDTTTAEPAPPPTGYGVPFGAFNASPWDPIGPLSMIVIAGSPSSIIDRLTAARSRGQKVIVNFAGGSYSNNYGSDGTFSYDVWKSRVDRFLSLDLKAFIDDGTLFAFYLIDEPNDPDSWGGQAVDYETLERMAKYSKSIWPGLTTIIRVKVSWLARAPFTWNYLDAGWSQYSARYGDVYQYRSAEASAAKASGLNLMFSMNVLNGGAKYDGCVPGTISTNCQMTATELRNYGTALASEPLACGLTVWQYDSTYFGRSDIKSALHDVQQVTASHPLVPCK